MMIILGVVQITSADRGGVQFPKSTQILASPNSEIRSEFADASHLMRSIPKCRVYDVSYSKYGYGAPMPGAACTTLAFAPNGSTSDHVMAIVAQSNGLVFGEDVKGFISREALEEHIAQHPGRVGAGVVFTANSLEPVDVATNVAGEPPIRGIPIEVLYNRSVVGDLSGQLGDDLFFTDTGRASLPLQVHRAVVEAMLSVHANASADITLDLVKFPLLPAGIPTSVVDQLDGVFVFLGVMFSFVLMLRQIVADKENNIIDAMRMAGLSEAAYWLSWFIFYAVQSLLSALLMYGAGRLMSSPTFVYVDPAIAFFALYLYFLAMLSMAMALAAVLPTTRSAVLVGFGVLLVGLMLQISVSFMPALLEVVYDPYFTPSAAVYAINLYPALLYTRLDYDFSWTVQGYIDNSPGEGDTVRHERYTARDLKNGPYRYASSRAPNGPFRFTNLTAETCIGDSDNFASADSCLEHIAKCPYPPYRPTCPEVPCTPSWSESFAFDPVACAEAGGVYVRYPNGNRTVRALDNGTFVSRSFPGSCRCRYSIQGDDVALLTLAGLCVLYTVLAWYLGQVFTWGHGRGEKWYFFLQPSYWFPKSERFKQRNMVDNGKYGTTQDPASLSEEARVLDASDGNESGVLVRGLVKAFRVRPTKSDSVRPQRCSSRVTFLAVDGLSLRLNVGECFALLGHNGAGKSTAIRMMNGLTSITRGDVLVDGVSVNQDVASVRELVGACPQHDILWPELSATEHLMFFGFMRGMKRGEELREAVETSLAAVRLNTQGSNPSSSFSGGMKRRLSVAIAAFGDKRIVFLDEPTTGMDPQNRAHVWKMITELKKDRVVLLTTHSMEEAEHLGDRIGVMNHGKLVALGDALSLKARFGGGYRLSIIASRDAADRVVEKIQSFVSAAKLEDLSAGSMNFALPGDAQMEAKLPDLFRWIESEEGQRLIKDWSVSQVSLEDVFVKLTKEAPEGSADADPKVALGLVTPREEISVLGAVSGAKKEEEDVEKQLQRETSTAPEGAASDETSTESPSNNSTVAKQLRALLLKDWQLVKRSRTLLLAQLLVPLFLVGIIFAFKKTLFDAQFNYTPNLSPDTVEGSKITCKACMTDATGQFLLGKPAYDVCVNYYGDHALNATCTTLGNGIFTWQNSHLDEYDNATWNRWLQKFDQGLLSYRIQDSDLSMSNPVFAFCRDELVTTTREQCDYYASAVDPEVRGYVEPASFFGGNLAGRFGSEPVRVLVSSGKSTTKEDIGSVCHDSFALLTSLPGNNLSVAFVGPGPSDPKTLPGCAGHDANTPSKQFQYPPQSSGLISELSTSTRGTGCDVYPNPFVGAEIATARMNHETSKRGLMGYYPTEIVESKWNAYEASTTFGNRTAALSALTPEEVYGTEGVLADCSSTAFTTITTICKTLCGNEPTCCAKEIASTRGSLVFVSGSILGSRLDPRAVRLDRCATFRRALYSSPALCPFESFDLSEADESLADGASKVHSFLWTSQTTVRSRTQWAALTYNDSDYGATTGRNALWARFPDAAIVIDKLDAKRVRLSVTLASYFLRSGAYANAHVSYVSSTCSGERNNCEFERKPKLAVPASQFTWGRRGTSLPRLGGEETYFFAGISSAFLRYITAEGNVSADSPWLNEPEAQFLLGVRPMTYKPPATRDLEQYLSQRLDVLISTVLLPFAVTLSLPVLVFNMVQEKELRLRVQMTIAGLDTRVFFVCRFLFDVVTVMVSMSALFLLGMLLNLGFFTRGEQGISYAALMLWSVVVVGLAFFLQAFFSKSRIANIALYVIVLAGAVFSFIMNTRVFKIPFHPAPNDHLVWPPLAFYRGVNVASKRAHYWEELTWDDELTKIFVILAIDAVLLVLLGVYLDLVVPRDNGVARHPLFCCLEPWSELQRRRRGTGATRTGVGSRRKTAILQNDLIKAEDVVGRTEEEEALEPRENQDVAMERLVAEHATPESVAVRVLHLRKEFGPKVAVDDVSMHMKTGEVFALLGPNGAGKSTLINMLTGMFPPTSGDAWINGHSIVESMKRVYECVAVVPQFDALWPSLSVLDHLLFYARLKGVPRDCEMRVALEAATCVQLDGAALHKSSSQLSGGMRRRLSLAVALVGAPKTVFLDEPTTGLDPSTRRDIWKLIERERMNRCIILTTHSMTEAEALASRVGIVAHGNLRAVGTSARLKQLFGRGYRVSVNFAAGKAEVAKRFILENIPGTTLLEEGPANAVFRLEATSESHRPSLANVFAVLAARDVQRSGVAEWGCRAPSLQDVFLAIASESEREYGTA